MSRSPGNIHYYYYYYYRGFSCCEARAEGQVETAPSVPSGQGASSGISVIYSNLRSIRNKLDEILLLVEQRSPDLMAFTETWLTSNVLDSEVQIPGYELLRADRLGNHTGGGTILYWKRSLRVHLLEVVNDGGSTALWCRINDSRRGFTVGVVYRCPTDPASLVLESFQRYGAKKDCLVVGDFNAPKVDWDLLQCSLPRDSFDSRLLESSLACSLFQHVLSPTRLVPDKSCNILDLVFSSTPMEVNSLNILEPIGMSDHCALFFLWTSCSTIHHSPPPRRNIWRIHPDQLRDAAREIDWSVPQGTDVNQAWSFLHSRLINLINTHAPISKGHRASRGPPWMDKELRLLMRKRKRLWDRFKLTTSSDDYAIYRNARNLCSKLKRSKRASFELALAEKSASSPKLLFSYMNKSLRAGGWIPSLRDSTSPNPLHDDSEKAEAFAVQYASVYDSDTPFLMCYPKNAPIMQEVEFDTSTVEKILSTLDASSSPGPDEIHPRVLKILAHYLAPPLTHIFQLSLEAGRLPEAWKTGYVKPIFKGGARDLPSNYRPVCLTSVVCKVMEKIVKQALQSHLAPIITSRQHGFQKGRSCITNLLTAREEWAKLVDSGKRLDVIFVDFSKAFDKVSHGRLLFKLRSAGVEGKLMNWISNFLDDRTMRVRVNHTLSSPIVMSSGVPQGSVLGPELFKFFINDLPDILKVDCLIYADDLKLWHSVSSVEDADHLQAVLDVLHQWSIHWKLPINYEKCSVMSIGSKDPFGAYHIGGYLLKNVIQEKDLGVFLSSDFKSSSDTRRKVASAVRMSCALRRSFTSMTPEVFRLLFVSHVRPILEYGCPAVFPLFNYEKVMIEKVLRRSSRSVPALQGLSYHERLQRLDLYSMEYRRVRGDLIYLRRILNGELGELLRGFFTPNTECSTRGNSRKLFKPRRLRLRNDITLSTRSINAWNSLPEEVVSASTEKCFKERLDYHMRNLHDVVFRSFDTLSARRDIELRLAGSAV